MVALSTVYTVSGLYLTLKELEALLVQDFHKLRLKVLVAVPGPARHRAVRLQVVQHVHLLLGRLHTTNMKREKLFSPQDRRLCGVTLTATDFTALMSFLLSRFFRILLISVRGRLLLKRMSLLQIPAAKDDTG